MRCSQQPLLQCVKRGNATVQSGKGGWGKGDLSASKNLFLASYCMTFLMRPEDLDLSRKGSDACFSFTCILLFFFVTQSFVPTLFSKVSYTTISLLMELIYYGESHLKMCCFTRQLSQGTMTCWLNCLPDLSEVKTDISDKPSIYRSVPNGIMKNVCICMRNL